MNKEMKVKGMKVEGNHKHHNSLLFFQGNSFLDESMTVERVDKGMRDN